ncbi:hypothetical protein HNP29_003586 [Pseudomonas alcaligenes]|nr:hypothetical protein [Pseudomonas alcaligenes]
MNIFSDVSLKTEAGDLIFSPVGVYKSEGVFDYNITCALAERFSGLLPGSFACRLYRNDIEGLISYFDVHLRSLVAGRFVESLSFLPLEGDIQIKGLDGEVTDFFDGYFSINILFNCGRANRSSSNTYFGFETVVEVVAVHEFCEGLKRFIL